MILYTKYKDFEIKYKEDLTLQDIQNMLDRAEKYHNVEMSDIKINMDIRNGRIVLETQYDVEA